jgi:glutaredoxin
MPKHVLHFEIYGISGCPYFIGAVHTIHNYSATHKKNVKVTIKEFSSHVWHNHVEQISISKVKSNKIKGKLHKTSPYIICNGKFVGGYDSIVAELKKTKPFDKY